MTLIPVGYNSFYPVQALGLQESFLSGSFAPQGTSAPIPNLTDASYWWTVSRIGVGHFRIQIVGELGTGIGTLGTLQSATVILQSANPTALMAYVGPITGSTIDLFVVTAHTGAVADISASGWSNVHWTAVISLGNINNVV
jgi:hypothetical protein